ncbi:MAG: hypothetical protein LC623_05480 [Halobacteriales archaeon]|nr:hypothetical protein [Halobacteriales archaeon]
MPDPKDLATRCAEAAAGFILANRKGLADPSLAAVWAEAIRREVHLAATPRPPPGCVKCGAAPEGTLTNVTTGKPEAFCRECAVRAIDAGSHGQDRPLHGDPAA